MKNLLELLTILSVVVAFGALAWAAMGVIASAETVNPDAGAQSDRAAGAIRALLIAGIALATYITARVLRKRMD